HMNEGHAALVVVALLEEQMWGRRLGTATDEDVEAVRQRCVFTTHTPVRTGHDRFPLDLVRRVLGEGRLDALEVCECFFDRTLNMTFLGAFFSRYINGVTLRHGQIAQAMLSYPVDSITNGVHAGTWTSASFQRLFDRRIPEWRRDNLYLRYAVGIPLEEVRQAHMEAKEEMLEEIDARTGVRLDPVVMTIGFARRATPYKRPDLLFSDLGRLKEIARRAGPLQVVYGGKAHPRDEAGKALIRRVFEAAAALQDSVRVLYLEDYDMALARYLCAGVDLWLNTPQKPQEASGTSGMKAALNGVPSLSVLDGWWIEGHVEGATGWCIGDGWESGSDPVEEAGSLYDKLEQTIVPLFYQRPPAYAGVMRSAIALNGSFFNAQRMLSQYAANAYFPNHRR
ncbi:MAG: alpha-glucan family phosphorylase, partial [Chloroflexi bacterium]|nr:alpha-glucan family phosphorylase [Chloroflexota bacterium]